jgi:hypothetical protein
MNNEKISKKDLYYTPDHDWINFQGRVAYVGIGSFKLTGFKKIQQLFFQEPNDFCKQGDIIASIVYHDYHGRVAHACRWKTSEVQRNPERRSQPHTSTTRQHMLAGTNRPDAAL